MDERKTFKKENGSKGSGVRPCHFKLNIGDMLQDNNRNLTIIDRHIQRKQRKTNKCVSGYSVQSQKIYTIRCNTCDATFDMEQNNLIIRKDRCPCCTNRRIFYGINDLYTLRHDLVKYFKNEEDSKRVSLYSTKQVNLICPFCKTEKTMYVYSLTTYGFSCPECSDGISYPNKFSYALLKQLPVHNVIHEYSIKGYSNYKYDNYFEYNNQNFLLEMDGLQHFDKDCFLNTYKDNIANDIEKNKIAESNGYILIRIDCKKSNVNYIKKSILNSVLSKYFDLSGIDWLECDRFAQKSKVMTVIKMYNDYKTVDNISKILEISPSTVRRYLETGQNLGLLNHNRKTNPIKHNLISNKNKSIIIEQIKDYQRTHDTYTCEDIANYYNYYYYSLRNFIDKCVECGELDYDIQKEKAEKQNNSTSNLPRNEKKTVYVYDMNNNLIGVFDSAKDAVIQNPQMDWNVKGIQKVCAKYQKLHKNCYFTYTPLAV